MLLVCADYIIKLGLGQFCEAIQTFVANQPKDDPTNIAATSFSSDIFPAYEIMYTKWLSSGEQKVRLASVHALGAMCNVLDRPTYEANFMKLIPSTLALYKKEKLPDHLPITQVSPHS